MKGCLLLALPLAAAAADDVFLWRGLDHEWQRDILGFETPHRLGSLASYASQEDAQAHFHFTPGVNGDYAFPTMQLSSLPTEGLTAGTQEVQLAWTDSVDAADAHPQTDTTTAGAAQPWALADGDDYAAVLLRGFDLQMACVPGDDDGTVCNSDGAWLWKLMLGVDERCTGAVASDEWQATCAGGAPVSVELGRAWTPMHGGGKPLSTEIAYNLTLHLTTLSGPADSFFTPGATVDTQTGQSLRADEIRTSGPVDLGGRSFEHGDVGVLGFGWELHETNGHEDLGRYFQTVKFEAALADDLASWNHTMNVQCPLTTMESDIDYTLVSAPVFAAQPSAQGAAQGEVCESDGLLFQCKRKGLAEQLEDAVAIKL